jgi:outer membrane protein assembly factor BamA
MQRILSLLFFMGMINTGMAQGIQEPVVIDSIVIKKNWRTKDKIVLRELEFAPGDLVTPEMMKQSIQKVWNMRNFSNVSYTIDSLENSVVLLQLTAQDAFTIVPNLSFRGSKKDFQFTAGVDDNNFLGKNIGLRFAYSTGTTVESYNVHVSIPRQLLYKNMTLSTNFSSGYGVHNRYDKGLQVSSLAFRNRSFSGGIGNPLHSDFEYTFSPNLSWNLFQHKTDTALATAGLVDPSEYTINFLALGISESMGTINHIRHQEDGYSLSLGTTFGIGLDNESPYFQSIGFGAAFHKLFNPVIQFSSHFSTGYTTSNIPSLQHNLGAGDVKGIVQGEIAGKAYYKAYVGGHFTYFNRKWLAMEQTFFANWGNGTDVYARLYATTPRASVGSGINFMIPMIPWMSVKFFFTYSGPNSNWFTMEF